MTKLINDIKFSVRLLKKTPAHTATTLFILVLGLSLYLASFTLARINTDKPMPFPDGDRYVRLKTIDPQIGVDRFRGVFDLFTFERLKSRSDKYTTLGAVQFYDATINADDSYPKRYSAARISVDLLAATNVQPILGRSLNASDTQAGAEPVVLLGYSVWQDYYNADPNIVGRVSRVNGEPGTIVGVMPEGFGFPHREALWVPLTYSSAVQPGEGGNVSIAGILKPAETPEAATLELQALINGLANEFPERYKLREALVTPYAEVSSVLNFGVYSLTITYIILALASVNLASLLYVRAKARDKELAVRASVGAGRVELAKQVLLESFLLCVAGLILSLLFGLFLLDAMGVFLGGGTPGFWYTFALEPSTVLAATLVALVIWLCPGLTVAYKVWSTVPVETLANGSNGAGGGGRAWGSKAVVATEVVLSTFILCLTVSLITLLQLTNVQDFGTTTKNTAVASLELSATQADEQISHVIADVMPEVGDLANVTAVAATTAVPGRSGREGRYWRTGQTNINYDDEGLRQGTIWISANYFDVLNIDILEGRGFHNTDTADSPAVAIINDDFAETLWPEQSALGKRLAVSEGGNKENVLIVGIISSALMQTNSTMGIFSMPSVYRPINHGTPATAFLFIRHQPGTPSGGLEKEIREIAAGVSPNVVVSDVQPLEGMVGTGDADRLSIVVQSLAFCSLVLAAIGVYAILARSITQRTREIGVRRALGSTNVGVLLHYGKQGLYFLLAGAVFGSMPAIIVWVYAFTQFSTATSTTSPYFVLPVCLGVTLLMFMVIAVASYIPTNLAIQREPGNALRYE